MRTGLIFRKGFHRPIGKIVLEDNDCIKKGCTVQICEEKIGNAFYMLATYEITFNKKEVQSYKCLPYLREARRYGGRLQKGKIVGGYLSFLG